MASNRDSIGTEGSATATPVTQGRKSLRSAAALDKQQFKGDKLNPSYAIDAAAEGIANAVDRSDEERNTLDLGKKYAELFGNVELVIINLVGTMVEDLQKPLKPYPGALEAFEMLKEDGRTVVLMTNSWKASKSKIVELLQSENFNVGLDDIFTSTDACKQYLKEKKLDRPYYLVHSDVLKDFGDEYPRRPNENVVIIGLPSTQFDYRLLSKGMNLLMDGAPLIALNMMKRTVSPNVRNTMLGPGPFINMLCASTDADPITVCKPSSRFYEELLKKVGCTDRSAVVVIGDDIHEDISAAKSLGLKAILTRTGRYQVNDEKLFCPALAPDATSENFAMGVRCVIAASAVSQMTEDDFKDEEKSSKGCGSIDSSPKEDLLTKKIEGYLKADSKSKRSTAGTTPIRLPSYIW